MSGKDKEIIELGEKCKIEFKKDGNVNIIGDCDGQTLSRTDVKLFDRVSDIIEDEDEV